MFIDTVDKLLQYRLVVMLANTHKIEHDLHKIKLLSQYDLEVINTTNTNIRHVMIAVMVSETISDGNKNDFSKLTKYLQTYSDIKYLVRYFNKECMLLLVYTKLYCPLSKIAVVLSF